MRPPDEPAEGHIRRPEVQGEILLQLTVKFLQSWPPPFGDCAGRWVSNGSIADATAFVQQAAAQSLLA